MKATRVDAEQARRHVAAGFWAGRLVDGYLAAAATRTPEAVAVVDRGRHWTYQELDDTVDRFASALQGRGVGPGDVVSWLLPNRVEAVVVHLATIRLGAVSNPIIPIYRHRETAFILRQAATKVAVVPHVFRNFDYPAMLDEIRDEVPTLETVVVVGGPGDGGDGGRSSFDDLLAEGHADPISTPRASGDIALLLYTSGTTSAPKGALHSHDTLDHENRSIIDFFGLSAADVVFMPSPVGHIIGVLYGLQLPFMLGGTVVLLDVWEPGRALELIEEHRCTFTVAATPFLHGLVHHPSLPERDVSSLRVFACGGADVPPELVRAATTALGCTVSRGYGSTEFPTATVCNTRDAVEKRARTDGRPIGPAEVRLAPDGELQVRGPELFLGYLDASLNDSAFTDDGWLRTGDLARIDGDGYVEITGRQKDIIIRGGENISAKEIEDHLFEHPDVADVAVVSSPDPVLGERVCAVVVALPGHHVTLPGLVEWLTVRRTARQKLPERLILLDELPRNPSGKIQKFRLRDLAREHTTLGVTR
ncbi:cyclohexanecarboxylate-CoA ligase [Pseudonocardia sulfidoxydans NBRC 16205]|uniref:Cyclohexanecarboxylate-CoA ligase n=1 Tax=Pseudonocardia sulfidoxydans NBRC 16205 TaxID=1223511 RepID=A0A511DGM3_9PSEU|nr:AMP-binding protein [Pseudonocardia sulfidoxydans]GEL22894.1 cyclohexanecarboxylate-CoA ligase [Pseudonocardia sulfidoxydans NBRC 16205]